MRRSGGVWVVVLMVLIGVAVGVVAYNAGVDKGLAQNLDQAGQNVDVVRVIGDRPGGFLPFGFLLFPLTFLAFFALARMLFWRRGWGGPPWARGGHRGLDEWHRDQHEQNAGSAGSASPSEPSDSR